MQLEGRRALDAETVVGAVRVSGRRNLAVRCERLLNMCANEAGDMPIDDEQQLGPIETTGIAVAPRLANGEFAAAAEAECASLKGLSCAEPRSSLAKIVAAMRRFTSCCGGQSCIG